MNLWFEPLKSCVERELAGHMDGSHDLAHILRVWANCQEIAAGEEACDQEILLASAFLHDIVSLPKNAPNRHLASRAAAAKAREILKDLNFPENKTSHVAHAIEAHSFSANLAPRSLEAKILQDADRLDALGAIGIARTFYVAGQMESSLFHPGDAFGAKRELDDKAYALDHFAIKLFGIAKTMQTATGAKLAQSRIDIMRSFCDQLGREIGDPRVVRQSGEII